tara:strand:- start:1173 stop:1472 length:300 start_codon:yes stop_codon:yes gene_type:complete
MGKPGKKASNIFQNPGIKNNNGVKLPFIKGIGSPLKHVVDSKGRPKGKGHLSKHKAGHWGPEGHGDRSVSGVIAGAINTGKQVVEDVKKVVKEVKEKTN